MRLPPLRHHCRMCGRLVCDDCSRNRVPLPWADDKSLTHRVCDPCCKRALVADPSALVLAELVAVPPDEPHFASTAHTPSAAASPVAAHTHGTATHKRVHSSLAHTESSKQDKRRTRSVSARARAATHQPYVSIRARSVRSPKPLCAIESSFELDSRWLDLLASVNLLSLAERFQRHKIEWRMLRSLSLVRAILLPVVFMCFTFLLWHVVGVCSGQAGRASPTAGISAALVDEVGELS